MRISDDKIKRASDYFNSHLSFEDLLKEKGLYKDVKITHEGVDIKCPFHEDWDPSMKINTHRNIFKCFSCGASGNLMKFIAVYDKEVLGGTKGYAGIIENLLKNDRVAQVSLGFKSIYEDSVDLDNFRRNGFRKFKIVKSEPKNFLELSNYIKQNGKHKDKIDAIKLMQDGLDAPVIFNLLFGKKDSLPQSSNVFNFDGVSLEDLLRED